MKRFSIITVCKNCEKDIEDTILSIIKQDTYDIQYIIKDCNSSDNTLNIVRKYKKYFSEIKIISNNDNGIYDAMNVALAHANGEWIAFLNAGDKYTDNALRDIRRITEKKDRYSVIIGANILISKDNKIIHIHKPKRGSFIAHPSCFVRRDIYKKYGNYNIKYPIFADQLYFHNLWKKEKILLIETPLSFMKDGGFSTIDSNNKIKELFFLYREFGNNIIISFTKSYLKIYIKKILRIFIPLKYIYLMRKNINVNYE